MKVMILFTTVFLNVCLYSQTRFSLKAHADLILKSFNFIDESIKKEIDLYKNFIIMGAGIYNGEDYSEDSVNDFFGELYTCKPVSSVEHFYDPYNPDYISFWNRCNPPYGKSNALNRARYIYNKFVVKYYKIDKRKSYYYLGRVLHILTDLSVPAHVHYTPHPFWPLDDNYEKFHKELVVKDEYLDGIKKYKFDNFDDYFINLSLETKRFPNDFEDGYHKDGNFYYNNKGRIDYYKDGLNYPLNKESIDFISKNLIKLAISYTFSFIEFFYNDVNKEFET
ncbi:MAG: hypothetical protein N2Z20_02770 [Elusimicrobiales bacterium]|nr:hypothetical protein [Elusimicrobiales bacterium]